MNDATTSVLTVASGAVLVLAIAVLWLRTFRATVWVVAIDGLALGTVALDIGIGHHDVGLVATSVVVIAAKAVVIPRLLVRAAGSEPARRGDRSLVNVPASLVASAVLVVVGVIAGRGLAAFVGSTTGSLVPYGLATTLVGFFVLVTRRRPVQQIVGLLLVDNGIALVAFLSTAGVPFLIELGASFDVVLGVTVLGVLALHLRLHHDDLDLDELRELHD